MIRIVNLTYRGISWNDIYMSGGQNVRHWVFCLIWTLLAVTLMVCIISGLSRDVSNHGWCAAKWTILTDHYCFKFWSLNQLCVSTRKVWQSLQHPEPLLTKKVSYWRREKWTKDIRNAGLSWRGNLLFYYEKRHDKEPIGVIVCEGCTIELSENTDGFAFQIVFPKSGCRTYHLAADSQEDMEAWMKVLSCASYDYMRLMVSELKQQLEEIQENSQAMLVENAMRDSQLLSSSYSSFHSNNRKSEDITSKRNARVNPFNQPMSADLTPDFRKRGSDTLFHFDTEFSESSNLHPKFKSFLEMHNEYGRQVKTLSEMWRESFAARPVSAFELTSNDQIWIHWASAMTDSMHMYY